MEIDDRNRRVIEAAIQRQLGDRKVLIEGMEAFVEYPEENHVKRYVIGGRTRELLDAGEPLDPGHVVTLDVPSEAE
jgi:hypothetical protein